MEAHRGCNPMKFVNSNPGADIFLVLGGCDEI